MPPPSKPITTRWNDGGQTLMATVASNDGVLGGAELPPDLDHDISFPIELALFVFHYLFHSIFLDSSMQRHLGLVLPFLTLCL